jgi:hypothetical protein
MNYTRKVTGHWDVPLVPPYQLAMNEVAGGLVQANVAVSVVFILNLCDKLKKEKIS